MKVWLPSIRTGSGSDVFVRRLAGGLRAAGIDVEVSWYEHRYELLPHLLRGKEWPRGIDVVHANSWHAFPFGGRGVPLVTTVHHCVHDPEYAPYRSIAQAVYHRAIVRPNERRGISAAAAVTAVSRYTAKVVEEVFGRPDVVTVHNGIDTERYVPDPAVRERRAGEPFRLLYVGNAIRRKGFDLLKGIMETLGSGYELLYTSGLRGGGVVEAPNARPLEFASDESLIRAYQECDALLFPTRYEGFGYAACEAMSCGKPVIATRASAIPEVVEDGVSGLLCGLDSIDDFVAAARRLSVDTALRERMGEQARAKVLKDFSEGRMVAQYIQLYEQVIEGAG